jgi:A/G-specific adenine glycosylase
LEGRDLPWRNTRDPYRIWLSEIMLQQTTVTAVIPYYVRFLERFPTVEDLSSAPLDEILSLWAGLGYYSRARNLHRTARIVVAEHGCKFPRTLDALTALPGIGRSTAGAILSIAYDTPAAILDGNVRRILVRLFAWTDDPRSRVAENQLWAWAESLTPAGRPHDYAQAVMDLGATICTPRAPCCNHCPLQDICLSCQKGLTAVLPSARRKKTLPVRRQVALIISDMEGCLVRQRPTEGFLGGMWELPVTDRTHSQEAEQVASCLRDELGAHGELIPLGEIRHDYSHFKLELSAFCVVAKSDDVITKRGLYCWLSFKVLAGLALHGAHRKVFMKLEAHAQSLC